MSLDFPNASQSLKAQPSLAVPSKVSFHTLMQKWICQHPASSAVRVLRKSCCTCGEGLAAAAQNSFFFSRGVEHHSARSMILGYTGSIAVGLF